MVIEKFLENHKIVKIGNTIPGYICCETIVDNPMCLIPIVRQNNCYISEIRWWDRVEIVSASNIGYGGPRDPRCPDNYFFAETDIYKVFSKHLPDKEYYEYIDLIKRSYSSLNLFPAFDIKQY